MTIHALDKSMRIASIPVEYRDRPAGNQSKLSTVSDGIRVLLTLFKLLKNYRPLLFFSLIGAAFGIASLVLLIPVLIEYFETGLVPRFPSLIVSVALGIICLLSISSGMVLGNIASFERRAFQWHANMICMLFASANGPGAKSSREGGPLDARK